jgi:hypothetical protein
LIMPALGQTTVRLLTHVAETLATPVLEPGKIGATIRYLQCP